MLSIRTKIANATAVQFWWASLITFWSSFVVFTLIDYAGEKWLRIIWTPGPDLHPNTELGLPLVVLQLASCALMVGYVFKSGKHGHSVRLVLKSAAIALATTLLSFLLFCLLTLYYHSSIMGRQL